MPTIGMELAIDFPAPALRTGLDLKSVAGDLESLIDSSNKGRWALTGVRWRLRGCGGLASDNDVICATPSAAAAPAVLPGFATQAAFRMYDAIQCSTLSTTFAEVEEWLEERHDRWSSYAAAQQLMSGLVIGDSANSHWFAKDATVLPGTHPVMAAIGKIEEALAARIGNAKGVIHLTPTALAAASFALEEEEDDFWYTRSGYRVIADAGYQSAVMTPAGHTAATDDQDWIYGSGDIFYAETEFDMIGSPDQENIDLTTNRVRRRGESFGIFVYEPCSVVAILACYSQCDAGGGSGGGGAGGTLLYDGSTLFMRTFSGSTYTDTLLDGTPWYIYVDPVWPSAGNIAHRTPTVNGSPPQVHINDYGGDTISIGAQSASYIPGSATVTDALYWGATSGLTANDIYSSNLHLVPASSSEVIGNQVPAEAYVGKYVYLYETASDGPVSNDGILVELGGGAVPSSAASGRADPPRIGVAPYMSYYSVDPVNGGSPGLWFGTYPTGLTYTYQWQQTADGGTTWTDITGATAATYSPTASNGYRVAVTATNAFGTSAPAYSQMVVATFG